MIEEEYQRILKNIKCLPENEDIFNGKKGFAALLRKDFLTDSEKSLKAVEDVVSGLDKKKDFWQGWQDAVKINRIEDTWNQDWLRKQNPWLMEKSDLVDMDYFKPVFKQMNCMCGKIFYDSKQPLNCTVQYTIRPFFCQPGPETPAA